MLRFHIIKHRDWKLEGDSDIRVYNFRTVLFIFKRESLLVCHKTAWIIYGWPLIIVLIYTWALFLVFSLMISIVYRYTKAYGRKYGAYTPYGIWWKIYPEIIGPKSLRILPDEVQIQYKQNNSWFTIIAFVCFHLILLVKVLNNIFKY